MKSVLILGAKGMLGQELVRIFLSDQNYAVTAWDREECDVTDFFSLAKKVADLWPDIIINAVAYNAVDACEESDDAYARAQKINADMPGELAKIAHTLQAIIVHYSTDYVFDGERPRQKDGKPSGCCGTKCDGCRYNGPEESFPYFSYNEKDLPRPMSRYAQTKYVGEQNIEKQGGAYYIIRLSKLFGKPGVGEGAKKSFFDIMKAKGKGDGAVRVVNGEMSKFTYAPDLARATKSLIEDNAAPGIYHLVNEDAATWYDGAKELYALMNTNVTVTSIAPEELPRPARRSASSVLLNTKRPRLRDYREALKEYITTTL